MKFSEAYTAIINKRDVNRNDLVTAVGRQVKNLEQQRKALLKCLYGRKRWNSGKSCKYISVDTGASKPTPWFAHIEAPRVLAKLDAVSKLHEQVSTCKKHLGIE